MSTQRTPSQHPRPNAASPRRIRAHQVSRSVATSLCVALVVIAVAACKSEAESPAEPEEVTLASQLVGSWRADMQASLERSEIPADDLAQARRFAAVIEMEIQFNDDGTVVSRANVADEGAEVRSNWEATQVSATVLRVTRSGEDREAEDFVVLFEDANRIVMTRQSTGEELVLLRRPAAP